MFLWSLYLKWPQKPAYFSAWLFFFFFFNVPRSSLFHWLIKGDSSILPVQGLCEIKRKHLLLCCQPFSKKQFTHFNPKGHKFCFSVYSKRHHSRRFHSLIPSVLSVYAELKLFISGRRSSKKDFLLTLSVLFSLSVPLHLYFLRFNGRCFLCLHNQPNWSWPCCLWIWGNGGGKE